jgi:dihydroflavonol-4-reductase
LGAHLVRVLLQAGHQVRALIRSSSRQTALALPSLELILGDILDPATLSPAIRGVDWVFHLAAPTTIEPNLAKTIVEGTANVMREAARIGVRRVIYTSSTAAIGYSPNPATVLDETSNIPTNVSGYHQGKWQAEKIALDLANAANMEIVVVNPSMIVGTLDYRITPSTAPIQRCLDRGLPVAFTGGLTIAHVVDVATGHLRAATHGRSGERYILGGDRISVPDYFRLIATICGRPAPHLILPRPALLAAGVAFGALQMLGMRSVPFTASTARHIAGRYAWYSSDKAKAAIGYSCRSAATAITDYVNWVKAGRPPLHTNADFRRQ